MRIYIYSFILEPAQGLGVNVLSVWCAIQHGSNTFWTYILRENMSSIYRGASGLVRVISQNRKSVSPRVMSRFVALGRPNLTSMFCIFFLEFQSSASAEDSRWRCLSWCCTVTSCNEPSTTELQWKLVSPMGIILPENSPPVPCSVRLARLILLSRRGVVVTLFSFWWSS